MIIIEHHEKVAVMKLNRGITNAINMELIHELSRNLQKINNDSNIRSVVLTSSNEKFFSIGFDIPELFVLRKEDFALFYRTFNQICLDLYTFPKLTIAAIMGHATAGGCILALCCDYRLMANGRKLMGLNEIKLGVPIPYPTDCILKELIGARNAREVTYSGKFFEPQKLLELGMVDEVFPVEEVLPKSIEKAKMLGSFPADAFQIIKHNRTEIIETQIQKRLAEKEKIFIDLWYSIEAQKRLKDAIDKF